MRQASFVVMTKQDRHVCVVTFGLNETGILAAADKPLNAALCFSMKKNHHLIVLTKYHITVSSNRLRREVNKEYFHLEGQYPTYMLMYVEILFHYHGFDP